jgi:hypothetical protein
MTRPAAALAAAVLVALTASGCETTQQESAKIARRLGHQSANPGTTRVGATNRAVRVVRSALVSGSPAAVAIELRNGGARAQASIPVLVTVRDAHGAVVYRNDTRGIEPSIQQLALLEAHATGWWVDNEVLANGEPAAAAAARVGAATGSAAPPAAIELSEVSASNSFPGPHVNVTVRNRGPRAASQLPLYAVAIAGGKVVGAGRAIVATLGPGASAPAEIPMTGTVSGARIIVSAPGAPG